MGGQRVNAAGAEAGRWAIRGSLSAGRRLAGWLASAMESFFKIAFHFQGCLPVWILYIRSRNENGKEKCGRVCRSCIFFTEIQPRKLVNRIACFLAGFMVNK